VGVCLLAEEDLLALLGVIVGEKVDDDDELDELDEDELEVCLLLACGVECAVVCGGCL
jgi:hypothetical protein